eukprot:403354203
MLIKKKIQLIFDKNFEKIVEAIENGDKFTFEKLGGANDFDLNFEITSEGIFPLLVATAKGEKDMVQLILKNKDIDINKTDCYGIMKILIAKGIDLMCKNHNGSNALHIAVKKGNIQVIQALLDIHYPLNYTKNNGVTALGIAAYKGSIKLMEMLYSAGADLNIVNKQGISPLYLAIKSGNQDAVKYLIERKSQVHYNDPTQAEFSPLFYCIKQGNLKAFEVLCDTGVDLDNSYNHQGYNPFTYAASLHQVEIVNYISLRIKNLNEEDPEGYTVFTRYLLLYNFDMANKLLSRGGVSTLEHCNRDGKTPLTICILLEKTQAVQFLITKGANPHIQDLQGRDSCDYAKKSKLFMNQPVFNNCVDELRKKPTINYSNGYLSQRQHITKKSNNYENMEDDKLRLLRGDTRTAEPIIPTLQNMNILPLRNISLPQIDQILQSQDINKIREKNVQELLKENQSLEYQQFQTNLQEQDQEFKKEQMLRMMKYEGDIVGGVLSQDDEEQNGDNNQSQRSHKLQSDAELQYTLEKFSNIRAVRNSQLKLQRSTERENFDKERKLLKQEIRQSLTGAIGGSKSNQNINDNFWEQKRKETDLQYQTLIRESINRVEKLKDPSTYSNNLPLNRGSRGANSNQNIFAYNMDSKGNLLDESLHQKLFNQNSNQNLVNDPNDADVSDNQQHLQQSQNYPQSWNKKSVAHIQEQSPYLTKEPLQHIQYPNNMHSKTLKIKGFNQMRESIEQQKRNIDMLKNINHGKQQIQNYDRNSESNLSENNYDQRSTNGNTSSWVQQVGNKAAQNLMKLRNEIEKELKTSKREAFLNSPVVQDELKKAEHLELIQKQYLDKVRNINSLNNGQSFSRNSPDTRNYQTMPQKQLQQSIHNSINPDLQSLEYSLRVNQNIFDNNSHNKSQPVLKQLNKTMNQSNTYGLNEIYTNDNGNHYLGFKNPMLTTLARKMNESKHASLSLSRESQNIKSYYNQGDSQKLPQINQQHQSQRQVYGDQQQYLPEISYYDSVVSRNKPPHLYKTQTENYSQIYNQQSNRQNQFSSYMLNPSLKHLHKQGEELYTFNTYEDNQIEYQKQLLKEEKERKYRKQHQELLERLQKKLEDLDNQVENGMPDIQNIKRQRRNHNHEHHHKHRHHHNNTQNKIQNQMNYDQYKPRRLPRPGVLQAPVVLNSLKNRKYSEKPRSIAPTGEFILYTDIRAFDREQRPCCSNSHSPESHRHHHSQISNGSGGNNSNIMNQTKNNLTNAFGQKEIYDKFGRKLSSTISRGLVKHFQPFK